MDFFGFTFVMFIGAAGVLLGFLILVVTAFTTSAAWGISSLVIPPVVIAFAVSHWSKAKNGFAILMIGVIIFAYGSWDKNRQSAQQVTGQPVHETATGIPDTTPVLPQAPAPSTTPTTAGTAPPATDNRAAEDNKPVLINIIDAHKYINRQVRVTTDSGTVRTGTLVEVNDSGIVVDFVVQGATGRVRTQIDEDKIHLIELLP
jgi:hypothetical protein